MRDFSEPAQAQPPGPPQSAAAIEAVYRAADHDLRAYLRHIRFLTDCLIEDHCAELNSAALEKAADLRLCGARMQALLDRILEFARLATPDEPCETIDTNQLVAEAVAIVRPPADARVTVEGPLPRFRGQPAAMRQVFVRLIENAIAHHDRGGARVRISAAAHGEECVFRVEDDGPGIASEFRDRAFEMFTRLRPHDDTGGSGMGLATAARIIRQHGGVVRIEGNGPARGTSLVFTVKR